MWGTRVRDHDFEIQMSSLNIAAAESKERAAKLEKEAQEAHLETERLKQTMAWRAIDQITAQKIITTLSKAPHKALIAYTANDPEASFLAVQLSRIFELAHWTTFVQSRTYPGSMIFGITILPSENSATKLVQETLSEAKIPFLANDIPRQFFSITEDGSEQADVTIIIGSKHPNF